MKKMIKNLTGTAVPVVAGAIGAGLVKNVAGKVTQNDKLRAALPLVLGLFLIGSKGQTMKNVGLGMIAKGGSDLVGSFVPTLAGIEYMDLSGIDEEMEIQGTTLNGTTLNGDDDDDSAY